MNPYDYIIKDFSLNTLINILRKYYSDVLHIDINNDYQASILFDNKVNISFVKITPRKRHIINLDENDIKEYLNNYAKDLNLELDYINYLTSDDHKLTGISVYLNEKVSTIVKRMRWLNGRIISY